VGQDDRSRRRINAARFRASLVQLRPASRRPKARRLIRQLNGPGPFCPTRPQSRGPHAKGNRHEQRTLRYSSAHRRPPMRQQATSSFVLAGSVSLSNLATRRPQGFRSSSCPFAKTDARPATSRLCPLLPTRRSPSKPNGFPPTGCPPLRHGAEALLTAHSIRIGDRTGIEVASPATSKLERTSDD
jgi:hypothetical protein